MNIITFLLKKFCNLEKNKLIAIITLSIIINVVYINVISFVTANIIQCIQKKDKENTYKYFRYFIFLSFIFNSFILSNNISLDLSFICIAIGILSIIYI